MRLAERITRSLDRGVSLIAVTTPDSAAAREGIVTALNTVSAPALSFDVCRGVSALNAAGAQYVSALSELAGGMNPAMLTSPADVLALFDVLAVQCEARGVDAPVIFADNLSGFMSADPQGLRVVQGVSNLRDVLSATRGALVMTSRSWPAPAALAGDVLVIDEPLPTDEERLDLARRLLDDAVQGGARIDDVEGAATTAAGLTRGLSPFSLKQTVALSVEASGLDESELRARFVQAVNETPGLRYAPNTIGPDDVAGLEAFKDFSRAVAGSRKPPKAIIFIDEIEKMIAGKNDSSGVSQDQLGQLLSWMQEEGASGVLAVGPSGTGKSMSAKALGAVTGSPTIWLDLGGMKGGIVGESEAKLRNGLKTVKAVAGDVFVVATCNSLGDLPPELIRRFTRGVWFFDLPTPAERDSIWQLHCRAFDLDPSQPRPNDEGWSGANIFACCEAAWNYNRSLVEASKWVIAQGRMAADSIEALRRSADGKYLSASAPGAYTMPTPTTTAVAPKARRMSFAEKGGE
jgi:hypothetical protein